MSEMMARAPSGDPIGYVRADGINAVAYASSSSHVIELSLNGGWSATDLSSLLEATSRSAQP
jgi:hypothetical protein